jgi:LSD1 subclass zinc finger protein
MDDIFTYLILFSPIIIFTLYHLANLVAEIAGDKVFMRKWRLQEAKTSSAYNTFMQKLNQIDQEEQGQYEKEYKLNPNKFIRTDSGRLKLKRPKKLDTNRKITIRQMRCSGCGAPLPVYKGSAGSHCDYCGVINAVFQ